MVYEIIETTRKWIERKFSKLDHEVELLLFTSKDHCLACNELEELVAQIAELTPKIHVKSRLSDDSAALLKHRINHDKHPALIINGKNEYNIRYFGVPSGLEITPFIETIITVSTGIIDLPEDTMKTLENVKEPVHIQVFTTPTCPYCPKIVELSNKFAILNFKIISDIVDAMEFRDLSMHYGVFGVPKTIINDKIFIDGMIGQEGLIEAIFESLKKREISFHV